MTDFLENRIYSDTYDLFDKCLYGGLGHGVIVFPTHIFKIIFTVIFPPIGAIINIIEKLVLNTFPYITWEVIITLLNPVHLNKIIYSYILTSLFYIPGLVYTLSHHSLGSTKGKTPSGIRGSIICDPETGKCIDSEPVK
jgi:hypothetical protein